MRNIVFEEDRDRLILRTVELDGYVNLPITNNKADTSRLDNNTCHKTFDCSVEELRKLINQKGY